MVDLHRTTGANVEQTNAAGETPLALALIVNMPVHYQQIREIVEAVKGQLNALPTVRTLATYCVRKDVVGDLMTLHRSGMTVDPAQVPLMHLAALHCKGRYSGMQLLDQLWQDPMERDAQGRTILELPEDAVSIHLRSQLLDAVGNSPDHDMAVMMAFHKRLGRRSKLQSLSVDLFRNFIIPHAVRHVNIHDVREARLQALESNEGVTIKRSVKSEYVNLGDGEVTLADFRREHFLDVTPGLLSSLRGRKEMLKKQLTSNGFLFDEPYTADYAKRALASIEAYL